MKPICVPCQRFYRCQKNGYYFVEGKPSYNEAPPGTVEPESWSPYKMWVGDLWKCEGCGAEIVSGVGSGAIAEHYEPDFEMKLDRFGARQLQVNDC